MFQKNKIQNTQLTEFDMLNNIQKMFEETTSQLNNIQKELTDIKSQLDNIQTQLKNVSTDTNKMNDHISFVENVYEVVKSPFEKALNYYYGNSVELQNIKRIQ